MSLDDLDQAKQKLLDKLGPNYGVYIQLLGKWFRGMISKEEFDKSAKQLIKPNFVLEHNKFWLAFFHHCANNAPNSIHQPSNSFQPNETLANGASGKGHGAGTPSFGDQTETLMQNAPKVRCLPNRVLTNMKIFVIAWELGLDTANDQVSQYLNLAVQHFLKNIITELICAKTAYRLRENRFKYAIGVKPMNPYLNNSLRVYTSNLEYDPYQIESNKMNSSLLDTCIYNDTLFPSRLYEAQALYEYACSTTSVYHPKSRRNKRLKLSEIFLNQDEEFNQLADDLEPGSTRELGAGDSLVVGKKPRGQDGPVDERRLTLFHLLVALLTNRTIIPSQRLYTINLERIFTKLS